MVKRIEKTYSVKDGQTTRTITLSAEEPLYSQSSESYSHSPHTSPYPSPPPCNLGMKSPNSYAGWGDFGRWLVGKGPLYSPTVNSIDNSLQDLLEKILAKMVKDRDENPDIVPYTTAESNDTGIYYHSEIVF